MLKIILRRLALSVPLLLVASLLTFVLVSLIPGDPARTIAGETASEAQYERVRQELGLDLPLYVQYINWLMRALRGDLGRSLYSGQSVTQLLNVGVPVTLTLVITVTIVVTLIGVALGLYGAYRGGFISRSLDMIAILGMAVPGFWLALVLVAIFSVQLGWFPAIGYVPLAKNPLAWAHSVFLPVVVLAWGPVAMIAKQTRDSVLDVRGRDFIRVMTANGFSTRSIVLKHVLRNASLPIVTMLGLTMISLVGAVIFAEVVFAIPGIANMTASAAIQQDIPIIQGAVLYITVFVVIMNLIVDVAYSLLDPRVRAS